jgi:soluble lytic murein transglycosylase
MSTRTPTVASRRTVYRSARRRPSRVAVARRRAAALVGTGVLALLVVLAYPLFHHAVRELTLPLRHEDIIRQQAREKGLDPALIAGVIYAESHFRDGQVSSAGAQGLMQLTPATAHYIAQKSGGIDFVDGDLATPQVNIAYGAYYLRYLLDHYDGNETLALAAYNGGEGNVDRWILEARQSGRPLTISAIPYGETRAYVTRVEGAQTAYRHTYRHELGLSR